MKRSKLLTKSGKQVRLTKRAEDFIEAMADPSVKSQSEAALRAGYSDKSARQEGSRLMTNADIREAIEQRKAELANIAAVKAETIIGAAVVQGLTSIDDCLDVNGRFDISRARRTGAVHRIKSISRTRNKFGESIRFEMYSAESARRELADYLRLKHLPEENRTKLQKTIQALQDYLLDFPDADQERAMKVFARAAALPIDEIRAEFETETASKIKRSN